MSSALEEAESLEHARRQIAAILSQIDQAAGGDATEAEFFRLALAKTMEAMTAVAGLVWLKNAVGQVEPLVHAGIERTGIATLPDGQAAHETLEPAAAAFVLANEARRIIGCDRVSVLLKRGRTLRLEAVSDQKSIDRPGYPAPRRRFQPPSTPLPAW
jgi:hypothetical protein